MSILDVIKEYIDAKVDYEIASRMEDESGYRISATEEERRLEKAEKAFNNFACGSENDVNPYDVRAVRRGSKN